MGFLSLVPTSVWVGLAAGVAFICGVAWIDHHGYERGKAEVQEQWTADTNARNAAALDRAKKESAYLAQIGENHAQELSDLEAQRQRDLAAVRAGFRLHLAGSCPAAPGATAPAERSDGPARCELSAEATSALQSLAIDADRNTLQLSACQAVIQSYLKPQETP